LVWAIDQGKIHEIITPSNCLRNNSNDKFLMQLEFGMAKKYVDDLSDNVKRGNRTKLEKGWLPGLPPLGYLNEPRERTIVRDPERFDLIRMMWDMLLRRTPIRSILETVNNTFGLRTRKYNKWGGKPLSQSTVYEILTNPFYYGLIRRREGTYVGKHDPMITEEEYWKAQEILGRKGKARPKTHQFAFTGLMRCGECGCGITAENKVNRYGSRYVYYHCTKKKVGSPCSQGSMRVEMLEQQITELLEGISVPEKLVQIALNSLAEKVVEEAESANAKKDSVAKGLAHAERKLSSLNQMRIRELIDDEEYVKEKNRLLEEKRVLEKSLTDDINLKNQATSRANEVFIFARDVKKRFESGSIQDKKEILAKIGSNLLLRDKKLKIELEKPLMLLHERLKMVPENNDRLEPRHNRMNTGELSHSSAHIQFWCTLAHDVRTFFERNDAISDRSSTSIAA
jgi:site-specific DNA recombinase